MTDKERIEELGKTPYYKTELYKETCEEVDNADGYDDFVRNIMDYKNTIKELENNQNAKAVEALQKVKEKLNGVKREYISPFALNRVCAVRIDLVNDKIDKLIKEYGGKNE